MRVLLDGTAPVVASLAPSCAAYFDQVGFASLKAALMHDGPALVDVISQELQDTAVPVSQWMG